MIIRVSNAEQGITEEFKTSNLDFIRRSFDEFSSLTQMTENDYKKIAVEIVKRRYTDTRFDNLQWQVDVLPE